MVNLLKSVPLSKEQKKAQAAYERFMTEAFAVMNGDKGFSALKTIPKDQVGEVIDELIEEQVKDKKEEWKTRMKALFVKRVEFERLVDQKTREFNSEIVKKMKEFTSEGQAAMAILGDIKDIVNSYKQTFSQTEQAAQNAVDNVEEEESEEEE